MRVSAGIKVKVACQLREERLRLIRTRRMSALKVLSAEQSSEFRWYHGKCIFALRFFLGAFFICKTL